LRKVAKTMGFKRTDSANRINSYDCEAKLAPAVGFRRTFRYV